MRVSKYNANGNDFVIFHTFLKEDRSRLAKRVCDRQKGVGADGLIVILPHSEYDFEWEFYNSDGSEADMCGNGSRAAVHYAYHNGLIKDKSMRFLTGAGVIEANIEGDSVEVKLTKPKLIDDLIISEGLKWRLIDTGVPHLVTFVDDLKLFSKEIAKRMRDEHNANVNFAKVDPQSKHISVRTYERGVEDETLACGTGMAAAFYSANLDKSVANKALVYPKSKDELELSLIDGAIYFKGEVQEVFTTNVSFKNN
jgi:diaminopimelate epimerase